VDALAENGVRARSHGRRARELKTIDARAYLELHIEQGPVLESMQKPTGVVLGTFGVERNMIRFTGQAAHSGSTPIPMRRDAFLAAAQTALECREIARRHSTPGAGVVCTVGHRERRAENRDGGSRRVRDVAGSARARSRCAGRDAARRATRPRIARRTRTTSASNGIRSGASIASFDPALVTLCEDAVREETGDAPRLPSGPLHDAAEMVPHMPVVMMFAQSAKACRTARKRTRRAAPRQNDPRVSPSRGEDRRATSLARDPCQGFGIGIRDLRVTTT